MEIDAQATDLELYLMGLMEYDSIVMTYFRPGVSRYYSNIISALKQGGNLLIHSHTLQEMGEAIGKDEDYWNHYFSSNEILNHLGGMKILFYQEGLVYGKQIIKHLVKKPVEKDAAKIGLFGIHTKGHEKSKSKQLELGDKTDLASYLLKPVQRLGKYSLFLDGISKTTKQKTELLKAKKIIQFQVSELKVKTKQKKTCSYWAI